MIGFSFVPANAVASGVFVEQKNVRLSFGSLLIPQKIALLGQYNSDKTPVDYVPRLLTSADDAASLYGNGSMLHLMAIKAFAGHGTVPIYAFPLPDENLSVAAAGSITVANAATAAGTISLYIAGQKLSIPVANGTAHTAVATAIGAAINAKVSLPVTATVVGATVNLTSKWKGLSANGITIEVDLGTGEDELEPTGTTLTIVDMASGDVDPSIEDALAEFGDTWYTFVAMPYADNTNLDLLEALWTARIAPTIKRPFVGMVGTVATYANFVTALSSRNSPATTFIPVESSPNLICELAAAAAGVCAASAQANPAQPYKTLTLPGILAGAGVAPLTYAQKDALEQLGGSVVEPQTDGTVRIYDLVTTYTTNALGAADDAWRYPETIANVMAKIYSLDNLFTGTPFDRAIVVDDDAISGLDYAISPKRVKGFVIKLIDDLWIPNAWSKNRDDIVASVSAEINSGNAGRIDVELTDVIAAGLRIVAVKYNWTFQAA